MKHADRSRVRDHIDQPAAAVAASPASMLLADMASRTIAACRRGGKLLATDIAAPTAVANDHGLTKIFGRQMRGSGYSPDLVFRRPGALTRFIQQVHIKVGRILCGLIERIILPMRETAVA